ncbi:hypothetical protein MCP_2004 [Methanocella paludicola SANAE]|uniref:DUF998 domain-containing protein n=1 Tax=Methanocella paludicola (strain DSM 17711 / JCM 13418 / NBRC 101707 / SANAE) TaxID=304371 RepID=D1Z054_METPS|nr:DUF998 domain-containing protein [Methanocella paludicola]BAI62076.1 hypothetical protein MCP_2004 [Methanocella paludicola SANAE]
MATGTKNMPLATIGGLLVILLFCIFTLASAVRYPGAFSPMDNWLSDLGTMKKNPAGYIYFNVGCILAGACTLFLVSGMGAWRVQERKLLFEAGRALGALSAFTLMLIGAFDENTAYHTMLSIAFFLLLGLFLVFTNISLWKHPAYKRWIGYYAIIAVLIDVILALTFVVYEHAPIWEWLSVFGALAWVGMLAYNMRELEQ